MKTCVPDAVSDVSSTGKWWHCMSFKGISETEGFRWGVGWSEEFEVGGIGPSTCMEWTRVWSKSNTRASFRCNFSDEDFEAWIAIASSCESCNCCPPAIVKVLKWWPPSSVLLIADLGAAVEIKTPSMQIPHLMHIFLNIPGWLQTLLLSPDAVNALGLLDILIWKLKWVVYLTKFRLYELYISQFSLFFFKTIVVFLSCT